MLVVIISERSQLSLQVDDIPDQHVVQKLPSYCVFLAAFITNIAGPDVQRLG
jgi:hypothetical protein